MITIGKDEGRFSRFDLISWWDQKRLQNAKILVVGAGALGNEIIKNCALLGIGNILVADMDLIENSNLSRSVLFRESDSGKPKVEIACKTAEDIYPEIKIAPFYGNIVHDLGLGVYFWADVIIGGLDNREARVAINKGAAFTHKSWIDGAIEVLNGVARVFNPNTGPCYECTMSENDWKILENRRSCALLTRDQMEEGKVPTTPTTGSIIAGIQVQEAIKILHGMDTIAGKGFVFSGLTGESYMISYPRKRDCFGHDAYQKIIELDCGVEDITVQGILTKAQQDLGPGAVVELSRDIIIALQCPQCNIREEVYRSLGKVTETEGKCKKCGQLRIPETLITLGLEPGLEDKTLKQIGVPYFDIVTARMEEKMISYLFAGDANKVLNHLNHNWRKTGE